MLIYIGRVYGTVVATIKHETLVGHKLLLVERLDRNGGATEDYDMCLDTAQAGVGGYYSSIR